MTNLRSTVDGRLNEINKGLQSPGAQLKKFFGKILNLFGIDVGARIDSAHIKTQLSGAQTTLMTAFDVGIGAQERVKGGGSAASPDEENVKELATLLAQKVEVDGTPMSTAEVILRGADQELQGKVIGFIKGLPFTEKRAICAGMQLDRLTRDVVGQHQQELKELQRAAEVSNYEAIEDNFNRAREQRAVTQIDHAAIATEIGEIGTLNDAVAIKSQLETVRTAQGAVAALQLLRTPEMLNQLKQLGVLGDDAAMAELISAASGPASEIAQNYAVDRSMFVLNVDATVFAIAHARKAVTNPSAARPRDQGPQSLASMDRGDFVKLMAKAEEWYFGDRSGDFPEELVGIQEDVVTWFEKSAERNFNATDEKLGTDCTQHFRAIAKDTAAFGRIKSPLFPFRAGIEEARLALIESQSRKTHKEFTNLSLAIYERLQTDGIDGARIASDYCSLERHPFGLPKDGNTMATQRLDTFWCQHPTEKFWEHLFTPRGDESPQQTAERVVGFLNTHPRDGNSSTNFLEYLAHAPCAEQVALADEKNFTTAAYAEDSQHFWTGLRSVLDNTSIPIGERQRLWTQLLDPLNNAQAWRDAGSYSAKHHCNDATLGGADYQAICDQMTACKLSFSFEFTKDVTAQTRASDLTFRSGMLAAETLNNANLCLTVYKRMQPNLPEEIFPTA
jgi:hypothetical protein